MLYSPMRPCFGCTKELLQAKVRAVFYIHDWVYPDPEMQQTYARLQDQFPEVVVRVDIEDADAEWAVTRLRKR